MVAIWAGYSFAPDATDQSQPLLDQMEAATGPVLDNGGWVMVEQTESSMTLAYRGSAYRFVRNVEMTITGTGFTYTHDYSGLGVGFVPGTVLSGTVTSILIEASNVSAGPLGGGGTSGQISITGIDQPLTDLLSNGIDLSGNDYIVGGQGVKSFGSHSFGTTTSIAEAQSLYGGAGFDTILGMGGDDTIDGGADADYLDGGDGFDRLSLASLEWGQWLHLGEGTSSTGDTFVNFESVIGTAFDDTLAGSSGDNNLWGEDGDDILAGGSGSDFLSGGNGNDKVFVEAGLDGMIGGDGFDVLSFELADAAINFALVGPGVTGMLDDGSTYRDFEGVIGSAFNDTLIGTDAVDAISGGKGSDAIALGAGADYLNIDVEDVVAGDYDYISDFAAEDFIFMPEALPLYVFDWSGTTYAITNAPGGGYWGMAFGGGVTVAEVQDSIFYV